MNKWALITGATSGIGKAFAVHFAKAGYNIIATGTRELLLQRTTNELTEIYGVEALLFIGDLSKEPVRSQLINLGLEKKVSVLINNAGYAINKPFPAVDLNDWYSMIALHISCIVNLTHSLLPDMISRNEGTIINVSSDAAYMILGKNAVYSGSKAFIKQFTHGLYVDLKHTNIKVQALCPGLTKTDLHEKMGMNKDRQKNNALIHWEEPSQVVAQSIKALTRNKAICISGWSTKMQILLTPCMPKSLYYRMITSLFH